MSTQRPRLSLRAPGPDVAPHAQPTGPVTGLSSRSKATVSPTCRSCSAVPSACGPMEKHFAVARQANIAVPLTCQDSTIRPVTAWFGRTRRPGRARRRSLARGVWGMFSVMDNSCRGRKLMMPYLETYYTYQRGSERRRESPPAFAAAGGHRLGFVDREAPPPAGIHSARRWPSGPHRPCSSRRTRTAGPAGGHVAHRP